MAKQATQESRTAPAAEATAHKHEKSAKDETLREVRHRGGNNGGGGGADKEMTPLDLDRLIHERLRLGIISALAVNETLSFNDLKKLLKTTDGNLSVHARKLEEAEYITCHKYFDNRTPKTDYRLTAAGRRALERYLNHMEAIIGATRQR